MDLKELARRTSGFLLEDLDFTVRRAMTASRKRILKNYNDVSSWHDNGVVLNKVNGEDFASALKEVQASLADAAGAPKIPEVRWQDVGRRRTFNFLKYFISDVIHI